MGWTLCSASMPSPEFGMLSPDDLVTGEAVALDLPAAPVGTRIASGILDVISMGVVGFGVLFLALVTVSGSADALQSVALIGSLGVVFVVYPPTVETLTRGKSVGNLGLALRVRRDAGGTVTAQQAFVRALVAIVEIYAFSAGPALVCCLVSPRGKRIGDYAAGPYVVRDRVPLQLPVPRGMPPTLAAWAAQADVRSLPVGLALAVRQYLGRLPALDPASRQRLGEMLATRVAAYVAPPPPPGTTPWDFLAATAATRRDRDLARLHRDETMRARLVE